MDERDEAFPDLATLKEYQANASSRSPAGHREESSLGYPHREKGRLP